MSMIELRMTEPANLADVEFFTELCREIGLPDGASVELNSIGKPHIAARTVTVYLERSIADVSPDEDGAS